MATSTKICICSIVTEKVEPIGAHKTNSKLVRVLRGMLEKGHVEVLTGYKNDSGEICLHYHPANYNWLKAYSLAKAKEVPMHIYEVSGY